MKRIIPILALGLMACAVAVGYTLPTSCSSSQRDALQRVAVPLVNLGLDYAVASGKLEPGDSIAIQDGLAVVVSDRTGQGKIEELVSLGLDHAVARGMLGDGDRVIVRDAETATVIRTDAPLPEMTAGKESFEILPPPGG